MDVRLSWCVQGVWRWNSFFLDCLFLHAYEPKCFLIHYKRVDLTGTDKAPYLEVKVCLYGQVYPFLMFRVTANLPDSLPPNDHVVFYLFSKSQCLNFCLHLYTVAPYQTFLNIDESFSFFFSFCHQLFHLLLASWEFPSLGIKQFQAGCGTVPEIIFFQFLSQAENDLPPHGLCFAGIGPGSLIKDRT